MGKSWKQKGKHNSDRISDYKWSSQCYTLKEILNNFKLPIVVQCREETQSVQLDDAFFDLRQPLLLYSRRSVRKVFSRCVRKGQGGTFKELSPEVVIPEDYAGWFKISRGLTFTKPSPHHTIQSVYECSSEFFLCTTQFKALILSTSNDGVSDDSAATRPIVEGEVLRKTGIHTVNQMMLPPSQQNESVGNRYLMCIDEKDGEVLIPLTQTGLFYEVSDGTPDKANCVLQIRDILDEMLDLPLYVRHVLGDPPPVSKFYSPCLKLDRVLEEETVMGTTLDIDDLMPLEIQVNSKIKFEIALNTTKLQNSVDYLEALDLCNTVAQFYVTDMKLAVTYVQTSVEESEQPNGHVNHSFVPDEQDPPTSVPNSQRTSFSTGHSDLGEVDANSEFAIQWDPGPDLSFVSSKDQQVQGEGDCHSIASLDQDNARKFNHVLGGKFVDTVENLEDSLRIWQRRHFSDTELYEGAAIGSLPFDVVPAHHVYKGRHVSSSDDTLTLSRRAEVSTVEDMPVKPSSPNLDDDASNHELNSVDPEGNKMSSQTKLKIIVENDKCSDANPPQYDAMDLSSPEVTPRLQYNKAGSLARHVNENGKSYVFSGRSGVFLHEGPCQIPRSETASSLSDGSDVSSLSSSGSSGDGKRTTDSADTLEERSAPLSQRSSFSELRNQLLKSTANAHEQQQEEAWDRFCFGRSASLPPGARARETRDISEEHSQSWEQIKGGKQMDNIKSTGRKTEDLSRTLNRLNVEFVGNGDRTHLISETSSDESIHSYSLPMSLSGSETDVYDSATERKATSLLAAVNETEAYTDDISVDVGVQAVESRRAAEVAQMMKIKHEIKRKKTIADWNDECSEI